jgi:hypothetical protein
MIDTRRFLKWTITPFLTIGAVLLLGLLAFTGMYVLFPILSVAITTFALSVVYEAEIYQQNISNALDKLFDKDILMQTLGKNTLLELEKTYQSNEKKPIFLDDYYRLKNHKKKSAGDLERLRKMELWFAQLLFTREELESPYAKGAVDELSRLKNDTNPEDGIDWEERLDRLRFYNLSLMALSSTAAVLMSLGTIYLLLDTLSILTFVSLSPALAPFVIIPLSIIAGVAYGFLTYNSLSEFIFKSEMFDWIKEFTEKFSQAKTYQDPKNIGLAIFGAFVVVLNIGLTICTAGTWWTIMNQARPMWHWLKNGLVSVLQVITPVIIAVTTLGFNGQNTIQTIKEVIPETSPHNHQHKTEKKPAPFNPFDYILKFVYFPFRLLMFIGHLISVSVTSDQMPGIPQIMAAFFAFVSEFLEDGHYFLDMEEIKSLLGIQGDECDHHEHGHQHSDIPNYILQLIFSPLFLSAAAYDYYFNQSNPNVPVDFTTCLYKKLKWNDDYAQSNQPTPDKVSNNWLRAEAIMIMDEQIEHLDQCYWSPELIEKKKTAIIAYKNSTLNNISDFNELAENPDLKMHRSWGFFANTRSEEMIEKLRPLAQQYAKTQPASNVIASKEQLINYATPEITADVLAVMARQKDLNKKNPNQVHYSPTGQCQKNHCDTCQPAQPTAEQRKELRKPGGFVTYLKSGPAEEKKRQFMDAIMNKPVGYDDLKRPTNNL